MATPVLRELALTSARAGPPRLSHEDSLNACESALRNCVCSQDVFDQMMQQNYFLCFLG